MNYQELEAAYIDAAGELRSKESSLSNVEPELGKFLHLRDCLREALLHKASPLSW